MTDPLDAFRHQIPGPNPDFLSAKGMGRHWIYAVPFKIHKNVVCFFLVSIR